MECDALDVTLNSATAIPPPISARFPFSELQTDPSRSSLAHHTTAEESAPGSVRRDIHTGAADLAVVIDDSAALSSQTFPETMGLHSFLCCTAGRTRAAKPGGVAGEAKHEGVDC